MAYEVDYRVCGPIISRIITVPVYFVNSRYAEVVY